MVGGISGGAGYYGNYNVGPNDQYLTAEQVRQLLKDFDPIRDTEFSLNDVLKMSRDVQNLIDQKKPPLSPTVINQLKELQENLSHLQPGAPATVNDPSLRNIGHLLVLLSNP